MMDAGSPAEVTFRPLAPDLWTDLETLFTDRGACGGCWCMWWRLPRSQYQSQRGEENRRAFHTLVEAGGAHGLLAYADENPAGWCAAGPRDEFPVLDRSRTLKRVDDLDVWAVPCFFVARPYRRRGLSVRLVQAAAEMARASGALAVEGYPTQPRTDRMPDAFAWTGTVTTFERAGFQEIARRSPTRPIMRRMLR